VRLRIPELLDERGLTPYHLAQQSNGRISQRIAYRYVELQGRVKCFDATIMDALCDVLDVEPNELFEREGRPGKRRRPKAS
jgi:DNA-binding Xre family transcriptional regulator